MQRYNFPLKNVLRWRLAQAEQEQLRLDELNAELEAIGARQQAMEGEFRNAHREISASPTALALGELDLFKAHVKRQAAVAIHLQADCRQRIAAQRQKLVEARRNVELLEKLAARSKGDWQKQFDRELEQLASDVYLAQWKHYQA